MLFRKQKQQHINNNKSLLVAMNISDKCFEYLLQIHPKKHDLWDAGTKSIISNFGFTLKKSKAFIGDCSVSQFNFQFRHSAGLKLNTSYGEKPQCCYTMANCYAAVSNYSNILIWLSIFVLSHLEFGFSLLVMSTPQWHYQSASIMTVQKFIQICINQICRRKSNMDTVKHKADLQIVGRERRIVRIKIEKTCLPFRDKSPYYYTIPHSRVPLLHQYRQYTSISKPSFQCEINYFKVFVN